MQIAWVSLDSGCGDMQIARMAKAVQVRLNDGEYSRLAAAAELAGTTVPMWLKQMGLTGATVAGGGEVRVSGGDGVAAAPVAPVAKSEAPPALPAKAPAEAPAEERSPAMAKARAALAAAEGGTERCMNCGREMGVGLRMKFHAGHERGCSRWRATVL